MMVKTAVLSILPPMNKLICHVITILLLAVLPLAQSGCVVGQALNAVSHAGSGYFERKERQRQVERVARDWCLTIRGSQVIPVYPLEEDIQPGDILVVDTPVDRLRDYWNQRGYLPIDHRFARIHLGDYAGYYQESYGIGKNLNTPHHWQFPQPAGSDGVTADSTNMPPTYWKYAPRAAFPSYSVDIRNGETFNGAFPVQGVPVLLSALSARHITLSVQISDAYTYGVDEVTLHRQLDTWLTSQEIKDRLRDYQPVGVGVPRYLRVITRVYLARSVNVSMASSDSSAFKGSAGAPKEDANLKLDGLMGVAADPKTKAIDPDTVLGLLPGHQLTTNAPVSATAAVNNAETNNAVAAATPPLAAATNSVSDTDAEKQLSKRERDLELRKRSLDMDQQEYELSKRSSAIQQQKSQDAVTHDIFKRGLERQLSTDKFGGFVIPGGTAQIVASTASSVSMNVTFDRPLAIGYQAVDLPIFPGGLVGSPVSTYQLLQAQYVHGSSNYISAIFSQSDAQKALRSWSRDDKANHERIVKWLETHGHRDIPPSLFLQTAAHEADATRCYNELLLQNKKP
jgi:hypothetical protein